MTLMSSTLSGIHGFHLSILQKIDLSHRNKSAHTERAALNTEKRKGE
jgi:hypothetical protein